MVSVASGFSARREAPIQARGGTRWVSALTVVTTTRRPAGALASSDSAAIRRASRSVRGPSRS